MARWSPEATAHLLRLDAIAASDPKMTLSVMADRINEVFGTAYTRNAVAGQIHKLKNNAGFGAEGRKPRQPKPETAEPGETAGRRRPAKRKLTPPKPKPAPVEPAPPRALPQPWLPPQEPQQSTHVALLERKPSQCAWPVNDGGPFLFCGAAKSRHHTSYCAHHHALSLARAPRRMGSGAA